MGQPSQPGGPEENARQPHLAKSAPKASWIQSVTWVKAHQDTYAAASDSGTLKLAKGNDAADGQAKKGRLMHPQPSDQQAKAIKRVCWHATAAS